MYYLLSAVFVVLTGYRVFATEKGTAHAAGDSMIKRGGIQRNLMFSCPEHRKILQLNNFRKTLDQVPYGFLLLCLFIVAV